jgi:protein phosphatase PTC7
MSRSRIIPTSFRSSLLSRRHCASVLRPPNRLGSISQVLNLSISAGRVGVHPNLSHLTLPTFALRAFSTTTPRTSAAPPFHYSISAAFSDKRQKLNLSRNVYTHDPFGRTKQDSDTDKRKRSRPKSGQDAFFISPIGESHDMAFGVVDGVGGWEESGVDPADFAHGLCEHMANAASRYPQGFQKLSQGQQPRPVELLDVGYDKVMEDASISAGGCTACIATASTSGLLHVAKYVESHSKKREKACGFI